MTQTCGHGDCMRLERWRKRTRSGGSFCARVARQTEHASCVKLKANANRFCSLARSMTTTMLEEKRAKPMASCCRLCGGSGANNTVSIPPTIFPICFRMTSAEKEIMDSIVASHVPAAYQHLLPARQELERLRQQQPQRPPAIDATMDWPDDVIDGHQHQPTTTPSTLSSSSYLPGRGGQHVFHGPASTLSAEPGFPFGASFAANYHSSSSSSSSSSFSSMAACT